MPTVTYVLPDGSERAVQVASGLSVMDGSVSHNLPGIEAECGGSCSCATCHVYLEGEWAAHYGKASEEEWELLEFLDTVQENSRLSCQVVVTDAEDGLRVTVPDEQG